MKMMRKFFILISMLTFVIVANALPIRVYQNEQQSNMVNGHEYVDLGLSVKWATMNVGASNPDEYGLFFAWGETVGYDERHMFREQSYKWGNGSQYDFKITKYCTSSSYGNVDYLTTLELDDDAAHVNWGGSWRMPTKAEQDELRTQCTWQWTSMNGVKGYKVIGPNGNFIFLPAAGCCDNGSNDLSDYGGYYRSSTLDDSYSLNAYCLVFNPNGIDWDHISFARRRGLPVRPVCQ